MDRGAWQTMVHRVAESWTWPKQLSMHPYTFFKALYFVLEYRQLIFLIQFTLYVICAEKPKPSLFFFLTNCSVVVPIQFFFFTFLFYLFIYLFFSHTAYGILVLRQGIEPRPLTVRTWSLTSWPLGSSCNIFLKLFFPQCFHTPLLCIFCYTLRPRVFISSPYISSLGESLFINWPTIVDCYCCV